MKFLKELMRPETDVPAKPPAGHFRALKYTGRLAKNLIGANTLWTRYNAAQTGGLFLAQAAAGVVFMLTLPVLPAALGIAGCALFAGIGLYAIRSGLPGTWKAMEDVFSRTFPKFNPLKKTREFAAKVFGRKPKNPKEKKTFLTPRQLDVFLSCITFEGAIVSSVLLGLGAATVVTASAPLAATVAAVAGATALIGKNVFDIFCCARTVGQAYKGYRKDKKEKAAERKMLSGKKAPETFTAPPQEAKQTALTQAEAAAAFNSHSGLQARNSPAAPAKPAPAGPVL